MSDTPLKSCLQTHFIHTRASHSFDYPLNIEYYLLCFVVEGNIYIVYYICIFRFIFNITIGEYYRGNIDITRHVRTLHDCYI